MSKPPAKRGRKPKQEKIEETELSTIKPHSTTLVNSVETKNGVDLIYPSALLVGSAIEPSSETKTPVTITNEATTSEKDPSNNFNILLGQHNEKTREEPEQKGPLFQMNYITQFYVGSLTVVGLYVFYRLIQKTK